MSSPTCSASARLLPIKSRCRRSRPFRFRAVPAPPRHPRFLGDYWNAYIAAPHPVAARQRASYPSNRVAAIPAFLAPEPFLRPASPALLWVLSGSVHRCPSPAAAHQHASCTSNRVAAIPAHSAPAAFLHPRAPALLWRSASPPFPPFRLPRRLCTSAPPALLCVEFYQDLYIAASPSDAAHQRISAARLLRLTSPPPFPGDPFIGPSLAAFSIIRSTAPPALSIALPPSARRPPAPRTAHHSASRAPPLIFRAARIPPRTPAPPVAATATHRCFLPSVQYPFLPSLHSFCLSDRRAPPLPSSHCSAVVIGSTISKQHPRISAYLRSTLLYHN
ncbi:hypothetical protein B0H14DRAFT_3857425 [Mycena olivaceomarginata]|nr:hypothetical protein B0H14DRAFT_3857425 [Mycena olivaceomarginata]